MYKLLQAPPAANFNVRGFNAQKIFEKFMLKNLVVCFFFFFALARFYGY